MRGAPPLHRPPGHGRGLAPARHPLAVQVPDPAGATTADHVVEGHLGDEPTIIVPGLRRGTIVGVVPGQGHAPRLRRWGDRPSFAAPAALHRNGRAEVAVSGHHLEAVAGFFAVRSPGFMVGAHRPLAVPGVTPAFSRRLARLE